MGGLLWSHAMLMPWPNGKEMVAECDMPHDVPTRGCKCGVWAWLDVETSIKEGYAPVDYHHVSGIVGAAGKVIRCERGWKAQRAKVLAIFDDEHPTPKEEIAEAFRVPVVSLEEYAGFCATMGLVRWEPKEKP